MKDLWVPISAALAQQRKVEVIANNVANANTAGFKKDALVFKEYLTAVEKGTREIDLPNKEWSPDDFYRTQGAENSFVKIDGSYTNFTQGELTPTGNPFDMALKGEGFFEVLTPNGIRFIRKGHFSISPKSELVTTEGFPILASKDGQNNKSAQDRIIKLTRGRPTVNLQGELFINGKKASNISVIEFNDIQALRKEGNSLYLNPFKNNLKSTPVKTAVYQGFVENSNVNILSEMSELIKANRQFESIQRVIKTYDTIAGRAVNDIANF